MQIRGKNIFKTLGIFKMVKKSLKRDVYIHLLIESNLGYFGIRTISIKLDRKLHDMCSTSELVHPSYDNINVIL